MPINPRITSVQWDEISTFSDLAKIRLYNDDNIKAFVLPAVLKVFDVDEIRLQPASSAVVK